MLNEQPSERKVSDKRSDGSCIEIVGVWPTMQGEGPFVGCPAIFVRLAGCNLQCPLCDTEYTKDREYIHIDDIASLVSTLRSTGLVVITGGEPFRQPIGPLIKKLLVKGYQVQVETNGTMYREGLPYGAFTIVCSPKSPVINKRLRPHLSALKYVVQSGQIDPEDGLPTMVLGISCQVARPEGMCKHDIYVQPADEQDEVKNALNLETAMASCQTFGYRLCLQLHKILGLP